MRRGSKKDISLVVSIISASFKDNKSTNFVTGNNTSKLPALVRYSFYKALLNDGVFINDDDTAACLVLDPNEKKISIRYLYYTLVLTLNVIGLQRIKEVLKREKLISKHQPKHNFLHLWYIGVIPTSAGAGKGTQLLQEILKFYSSSNKMMYLETSTIRNLPFYKKNGFDLVKKIENELPYILYIFKNSL
jgi:ribosomal protein S18 acetylase RimI-like enzyme